ncbi:hypothetical protein [Rhodohalobacter sulfatireducens]|uniref:SGNH/GDSL hydrolase family protein n=1 Tax=Rhodohalobacter sulfatireducens TaxID=2911366 RepID=A0ABS9KAA2_9BACT|nr:hypothetical protein [Rhodohalobacter sulfatireducens]MCG2587748.1 hypothetical protein [Rhodohalobacter sulfatireducens]
MDKLKILIVSGCLAEQNKSKGNIPYSLLYHQVLKKDAERLYNISMDFDVVRYERFNPCMDRITESFYDRKPDIILFQVRGNHYLKTIKFFISYQSRKGAKKKYGMNILQIRESLYEKYMPYRKKVKKKSIPQNPTASPRSKIYITLRKITFSLYHSINYLIGLLIGNEKKAYKNYLLLVKKVINLAETNETPILFLGVTSRPINTFGEFISKRLNNRMRRYITSRNLKYIDIFGVKTDNGTYKFDSNISYSLNSYGHQEIAEKLLPHLVDIKI